MSTFTLLLATGVIGGSIALWLIIVRKTAWYKRLQARWLIFKLALLVRKRNNLIEQVFSGNYVVPPKEKLKRSREAVEALRAGYWTNRVGETIHLDPGEYSGIAGRLKDINEALEEGYSYEKLGTTKDEVIGFRSGEAHKRAARLIIEDAREHPGEKRPDTYRLEELTKDGNFSLEDIGSSDEELEALDRECSRRTYASLIGFFREWAVGGARYGRSDPEEFEKDLKGYLTERHHTFTYAELETSEEECTEMIRLGWQREIESRIAYLKSTAEEGDTGHSIDFAQRHLYEALEKAGRSLSDFNLAEADIDDIVKSTYVNKARKLLDELRTPEETWLSHCLWDENHILGDPQFFVQGIRENLELGHVSLHDIGSSEQELDTCVQVGHVAMASLLLKRLERVSQTPRRPEFELFLRAIGPNARFMDDPENPVDREKLEPPYPVERDIEAIRYHLKEAGIGLEKIGSSRQKLQELRVAIEAR